MRDKLLEMLMQNYGSSILYWDNENPGFVRMTSIINIADFLIENGVTIPIRCGECQYNSDHGTCRFHSSPFHRTSPDGYCECGKRKESEEV